jgi:hypothetical protein
MGESISYKSIFDAHDKKLRDIVAADQEAKAMGQLVGRFYREQIADGYAFYVITKENKTKCKLVVVTGLGWQERSSLEYWAPGPNGPVIQKYRS